MNKSQRETEIRNLISEFTVDNHNFNTALSTLDSLEEFTEDGLVLEMVTTIKDALEDAFNIDVDTLTTGVMQLSEKTLNEIFNNFQFTPTHTLVQLIQNLHTDGYSDVGKVFQNYLDRR